MKRSKSSDGLFSDGRPESLPYRAAAVVHDWSFLKGFRVQVQLGKVAMRNGKVEDVTGDGRALWLAADGVFGRQLIDQSFGYRIVMDLDQFASFSQRRTVINSTLCQNQPRRDKP